MNLFFLLQVSPATANAESGVKSVPLWDIIQESNKGAGWIVNLILLIMLGYAIYVFVERFLALRKAMNEEKNLLDVVIGHVRESNFSSAKETCRRSKESPIAKMLLRGISLYEKGDASESGIRKNIESTGKFEISRLEQRLNYLATAAGAAPMIGFLGTVLGMMMVFIDLENSATLELKVIAPGIMTAMVTTVSGLIVGIVSFMSYNYLVGRIGKVIYQMEMAALEFMESIDLKK